MGAASYLHGAWTAVSATLSSDARMKKDIVPLYRTMASFRRASAKVDDLTSLEGASLINNMVDEAKKTAEYEAKYDTTMVPVAKAKAAMMTQEGADELKDAAAMFSELRPVSYYMKER